MEACLTDLNTSASTFHVPSDLWPGDAQKVRTQLVHWLSEQESSPEIELGDESTDPTVSALQLIVAATRRISGPPVVLGTSASAALARLAEPLHMEWDAQ